MLSYALSAARSLGLRIPLSQGIQVAREGYRKLATLKQHPNLPDDLQGVQLFAVGFSGGKDSIACVLHLLELGIPKDRIELWHHKIDPPDKPFMDWPCTEAYCRAVAGALDIPLYLSLIHI